MKRILPWFLLGLSLATNAFFALGYLYGGHLLDRLRAHPEARLERLARRLHLNPAQTLRLRGAQRVLADLARGEALETRHWTRRFWDEFRRTPVDPAAVDRLLAERGARELRYRKAVANRVGDFLAGLSPQQRQGLLDLLSRRDLFYFLHGQTQKGGHQHGETP